MQWIALPDTGGHKTADTLSVPAFPFLKTGLTGEAPSQYLYLRRCVKSPAEKNHLVSYRSLVSCWVPIPCGLFVLG
jgi:hypothetical protein